VSEVEKYISEKIAQLVPNYKKLDVRANIGDKSYAIEFFVTIDNRRMQCYDMVDDGIIEENELDSVFKAIAEYIRNTTDYITGKINKYSFTVNK